MNAPTGMGFVELIARALCVADNRDPNFEIVPGMMQWRKFEFTAAIVAKTVIDSQKTRIQVKPNDA